MAIDDNTSYELTGAQVKDLASKINAKEDSANLATVATTGNYSDLSGTPTIPTQTSDLTNDGSDGTSTYVEADDLATVATSGLYSDLSGAPTIPPEPLIIYTSAAIGNAFQTYSDDNLTVVITGAQISAAFKAGRQIILTTDTILDPIATIVAFTEGPEDMFTCVVDNTTYRYGYKSAQSRWVAVSRTVNDGTLTIQHNGTDVQTFTANQSTNVTANIETIWADDIAPATQVPPITTSLIQDGAVTNAKIDWSSIPIQCGSTYINAAWTTITFDTPFDTIPVVSATLNTNTSESATATFIKIANISKTSFRVVVGTASGFGTGNVEWIATTLNKN